MLIFALNLPNSNKKTYHFYVACIDMKDAIPKICVKDAAPKSDD